MNKHFKSVCFFSLIFFIIDQAVKLYLKGELVFNQSIVLVKNFFNITLVKNTGAAFSILENNTTLLIVIGILAFLAIIFYVYKLVEMDDFDVFSYSLLLGGVLGNLVDRIVHGYVIDYISLNIFGYHIPIFNFADICIVISVILIIWTTLKGEVWKR